MVRSGRLLFVNIVFEKPLKEMDISDTRVCASGWTCSSGSR